MKNALGILLAIAIIIIFLQNICKKPVTDSVSKAEYHALETRIKDTAKYYEERLKADSTAIADATAHSMQQRDLLEISNDKLNTSQITIHRLAAKIEGAKLELPDSTWVQVSPHFVEGCDSLKDKALAQQEKIDQQQEDGQKLTELMMYEIAIRDSTITAQKEFNRKFLSQLDDCMGQLQKKVNEKQRNKVYAGIGLLGNKINPLAGGQINFSYLTRGGQIYEITGATVGNTWYGGVGTKMLISFRK